MIILLILMLLTAAIIQAFFKAAWGIYYKIKINNLLESINIKEDLLYTHYKDFMEVIMEVFRRKGYTVKKTCLCGEEGNGLILDNLQYAEIWKHGIDGVMDVEAAMKLARCMQVNSTYRGMLVTLGDFKTSTKAFCRKYVIECINGDQLLAMCKEVQKRKAALEPS